jgi:peroxiredoxin
MMRLLLTTINPFLQTREESQADRIRGYRMSTLALTPRQPVPALNIPLVGGDRFVLGAAPGNTFDLIVFYRGLHCPICAKYLMELERLMPEFEKRGVNVIAVSSDSAERAEAMAEKIKAVQLKVGYAISLQSARQWGLYISASVAKHRLASTNPPCSVNPPCSLSVQMGPCTTAPPKPCPLLGHNFKICWRRLILPWRKITLRAGSTPARFEAYRRRLVCQTSKS